MVRTGLIRNALRMSWCLVAISAVTPGVAKAKDKHTAEIQVANKTGKEFQFVTVAHKYSDNYKNAKTWGNLPNGASTKDPLISEYNTGFLTTGRDWWVVTWKYKDEPTVYVTDPHNLRSVMDAVEKFALEKAPAAGAAAGGAGGGAIAGPVGGEAGAAIGTPAAKALGDLLLNTEPTKGFKQHILREEDSKEKNAKPTVIDIYGDKVKFVSPSGTSETGVADSKKK